MVEQNGQRLRVIKRRPRTVAQAPRTPAASDRGAGGAGQLGTEGISDARGGARPRDQCPPWSDW